MTLVIFRLLLIPSRFLFSGLRFVLFNTFVPAIFFASLRVFILSLSPPLFFFSCATATYRSINSIPTFCHRSQPKLYETNFKCHLITAFFGITEFRRSNTGFSTLTLKKYPIDPVMSWLEKGAKVVFHFLVARVVELLPPELDLNF